MHVNASFQAGSACLRSLAKGACPSQSWRLTSEESRKPPKKLRGTRASASLLVTKGVTTTVGAFLLLVARGKKLSFCSFVFRFCQIARIRPSLQSLCPPVNLPKSAQSSVRKHDVSSCSPHERPCSPAKSKGSRPNL